MDAKPSIVKIDGEGAFMDLPVVNAEAIGLSAFSPLADMAVVIADPIF
jgi:hypothetical protein